MMYGKYWKRTAAKNCKATSTTIAVINMPRICWSQFFGLGRWSMSAPNHFALRDFAALAAPAHVAFHQLFGLCGQDFAGADH